MQTNAIYCGDAERVLANTLEFPDGLKTLQELVEEQ